MLASVFIVLTDITYWYIVLICMAGNPKQICSSDFLATFLFLFSMKQGFWPFLVSFVQGVWLRGQAAGQCYRKRVSPVCRDGPWSASSGNCEFHQQSDAGTTVTQMRNQWHLEALDQWKSRRPISMTLTRVARIFAQGESLGWAVRLLYKTYGGFCVRYIIYLFI